MKTLPSLITLVRLIFQFYVIGVLCFAPNPNITVTFIIFLIASLADKLDGYVARKYNQTSIVGMIFDVAADKITTLSMLIFFSVKFPEYISLGLILIIVIRDLLVSSIHQYGYMHSISSKGNFFGKYKGVLEIIAIYLSFSFYYDSLSSSFDLISKVISLLLFVSASFGIYSMYLYLVKVLPFVKKDLEIK